MLRAPSRRKQKPEMSKLNLIPILDAVFIFIFFLLMSTNFIKIYEIPSNVPIISSKSPPKNKKKPLALTLKISPNQLTLYKGIPQRAIKSIPIKSDGTFDFEKLRTYLIRVKKRYKSERSIILEPAQVISYEVIVQAMDAISKLRNTDDEIFTKDKNGIDIRVKELFNDIIFGNIQSER